MNDLEILTVFEELKKLSDEETINRLKEKYEVSKL